VEWLEIFKGALAASPATAVLGLACWVLWKDNKAKDVVIATQWTEIARISTERVNDLKAIAKLDD
jgi:hypothetical protein